ncbi:MAG: hypothetical protein GX982_00295 [Tissierellia bacterium]|nr:hypothetical protein [Tissierellia bacterium]
MSKVVDARGLSCPEPVVLTMKAVKDNDEVEILVDTNVSKENVRRFLEGKKYLVEVEEKTDYFILKGRK